MKRILVTVLLGCFSAAVVGCSASATVDPDHVHTSSSTSSETSVKKTTYKDANGNVVEQKVERQSNP